MRGIGCTLTLLFALSAQAIDYEAHRHDVIPTRVESIVLTSRDFLEQLNLLRPRASYTLQEATEHLLHFGALLRARFLDTFGGLLYIYYDDFSIAEVEALHKVYQEILERRYDVFSLVPDILKNSDTRPSRICTEIYTHAEPCLRSSANMCRRIKKQYDLPHSDDFRTHLLNITYLMYRSSKISKQYPKGFSLSAILRLLQREVLTITPGLLSGLLYNVRYDSFDDDIRFAERELVRYLHKITSSTEHTFIEIMEPIPMKQMRKFHSASSFLKYYINIVIDKLPDENLKKHAVLISKRIIDDVDTIDENIQLLGNVYENRQIHIRYLFDLVLPDDLLDKDVIEAKRYLVMKLSEFDVVERYLKVQKYLQATPAQLVMEITGQLKDINFIKDIATSLRMHARFWRKSIMIESLDELLELFDAYENLRQVPHYQKMMMDIDMLRKSLWDTRDVPVEILCSAPRACLRLGLQLVLKCKFVSHEIKTLIISFLKLSEICVMPEEPLIDISLNMAKIRSSKTESCSEYHSYKYVAYNDDYNRTYNNHYNSAHNDYYNSTHNNHYSSTYNDDYNRTYNNHYNSAHNDYYNSTHNNHYSSTHNNNYSSTHNNHYSSTHNNNYSSTHNNHYSSTHNNHYSSTHNNYYDSTHNNYYDSTYNYYDSTDNNYYNSTDNNYYDSTYNDYYNSTDNNYYDSTYNNHYSSTYNNYYDSTYNDYYNSTDNNYYDSTYNDYYDSTYNDYYNSTHYYNISRNDYYIGSNNYYKLAHHNHNIINDDIACNNDYVTYNYRRATNCHYETKTIRNYDDLAD
ncbi:hypothetical protein DMN91_011296 [Ooceraea biroi]|uniref:Zonadhesin n=1 Tax=Ooceraea biroi TaxID=2015173 RepID=A0A3L8D9R8_OOCBI|nr:hypothetical protein DMN91_011296 [Ooceraea biroi]